MELLLDIRNLRIEATSYPPGEPPRNVVIVDNVSVKVERGKVLGLIGESGAGKSTIGLVQHVLWARRRADYRRRSDAQWP